MVTGYGGPARAWLPPVLQVPRVPTDLHLGLEDVAFLRDGHVDEVDTVVLVHEEVVPRVPPAVPHQVDGHELPSEEKLLGPSFRQSEGVFPFDVRVCYRL